MMVLPNKLPIKLSDEIPTVDLRMPEPEVRPTRFATGICDSNQLIWMSIDMFWFRKLLLPVGDQVRDYAYT